MEEAAEVDDVGVDPPDEGPFVRDPPDVALSLEALSTPCEDRLEYEALEGTPPEPIHNNTSVNIAQRNTK